MLSFTKKGHESIYMFEDTIWFVEKNTVKYHTYILFIFIQYTNLDCSHLFIHKFLLWALLGWFIRQEKHAPTKPSTSYIHWHGAFGLAVALGRRCFDEPNLLILQELFPRRRVLVQIISEALAGTVGWNLVVSPSEGWRIIPQCWFLLQKM